MSYDVIIIGAGPSGSLLGAFLAESNYKVLILEKQKLPRYKPCGGGLCLKALTILGNEMFDQAEDIVDTMVITYNHKRPARLVNKEPLIAMVSREKFDYWLAQKAVSKGAHLETGVRVNDILVDDMGVIVTSDQGEFKGKVVVGADGVNGITAKAMGLRVTKAFGLTLEGELEVPQDVLKQYKGICRIDFGCIPGGYGWIFPKEDHLSVGVITFSPKITNLKYYFAKFTEGTGLHGKEKIRHAQGYLIPYSKGIPEPLTTSRGILVGDAAGLVDPFTGEGIYYALRSAQLAFEAVDKYLDKGEPLANYEQQVAKEILTELRKAYKLSKLAFVFPSITQRVLARDTALVDKMCKVVRGEQLYGEFTWRELVRSFCRAILKTASQVSNGKALSK